MIANALSHAFLTGEFTTEQLAAASATLFGKKWRWVRPLVQRVVDAFGTVRPSHRALVAFIRQDAGFRRAVSNHRDKLKLPGQLGLQPRMVRPVFTPQFELPKIATEGDLARWLGVSFGELDWLADCRSLTRHAGRNAQHYRYQWAAKRGGTARLIEAPKPKLKSIQRELLGQILDAIPPHEAAHGFRQGRSIRTFAEPHVGRDVVLKMDLADFFPSVAAARVSSLFRSAGYPERVASLLTGLCVNWPVSDLWQGIPERFSPAALHRLMTVYDRPHLPQGAPTSPAIANLAAWRLDNRLSGLARSADAVYTRYADDLVFSGGKGFSRVVRRFELHVAAIVDEEGFAVQPRKTRRMGRGQRQQIAGVVVNATANVARRDFDRLKATLTNCIRSGPASQNHASHADFRAHLAGRIAHVASLNAGRGAKLTALFRRISWLER